MSSFFRGLAGVLAIAMLVHTNVAAQNLALSLFERYLEPLRVQAAIPGLAAAIVADGQVVWERGLGVRDVEAQHAARPDTPYPLGDLTQVLTTTLVLKCAEQGGLRLDQPIVDWVAGAESGQSSLRHLLAHAAPLELRGFAYSPARIAPLMHPVEACAAQSFRQVLAIELLDRLAMIDAVPGHDILATPLELREALGEARLARYADALQRMALPYRVDRRGRATRNDLPAPGVDGARGVVASVRDLAKFDVALDAHLLLRAETLEQAWTPVLHAGSPTPLGLGWFVQIYQGEKVVWHFGQIAESYSSLILKVPGRRLTLILLANSDGLSAPFPLADGDITSSLFARTFLRLFL